LWIDLSVSLWECDAGLFDWILNDNTHNCGLTTYDFNNSIFELKWDAYNMGGDLLAEQCFGVALDDTSIANSTNNTNGTTSDQPEEPVVALNVDSWF
jgi:hypothetical protein